MFVLLIKSTYNSFAPLLIPIILVSLPFLIFEIPGFYGDDFDLLSSIESKGFWKHIFNWSNTFGLIYRPIGYFLGMLPYAIIGNNNYLLYCVSLFLYLGLISVIFYQLKNTTKSLFFSCFGASIFGLFPTNPTAFLQLPSMVMSMSAILIILTLGYIVNNVLTFTNKNLIVLTLLWITQLLVYEQITGLVVVIIVTIILVNFNLNTNLLIKKAIFYSTVLGFTTLIFILLYFFSSSNPKVISLKKTNILDCSNIENARKIDTETPSASSLANGVDQTKCGYNKYSGFLLRVSKTIIFLLDNILYFFEEIKKYNSTQMFFLIIIFLIGITLSIYIPIVPMTINISKLLVLIGLLWVITTIAPFFVYKSFHMPPYNLMFPSIGVSLIITGLVNFLYASKINKVTTLAVKSIFITILITFSVSQYGYYLGLKEELGYWESLFKTINPVLSNIEPDEILQISEIPDKNNNHIFWLTKATGLRHFKRQLYNNGYNDYIQYNPANSSISIGSAKNSKKIYYYNYNTSKKY
jgi:hypothetical protein